MRKCIENAVGCRCKALTEVNIGKNAIHIRPDPNPSTPCAADPTATTSSDRTSIVEFYGRTQ